MSLLNVSNSAERATVDFLIAQLWAYKVKLFSNNLTLDEATTEASFTEANYTGYADVNLVWAAAATDPSGLGYTLSQTITFPKATGGATQTVYGYYAVSQSGKYVFGRKFLTPVTVSSTVGVDPFTIKYTLREDPS